MSTARSANHSRLRRASEALYARVGSRILLVCIGGAGAIVLLSATTLGFAMSRYLGLSGAQTLSWLAISSPISIAITLAGLAPSLEQLRTILSWSGHHPTTDRALETWEAIVRLPIVITRCALAATVATVATAVYVVARFHEPPWATLPILGWDAVLLVADWMVVVFCTELLTRPMLREVVASLPAGFTPHGRRVKLRARALAPLPIVTAYGMLVVGASTSLAARGPVRFTIALVASLAAIAVASVIFAIVTRSLLAPIENLIEAIERVRQGDLGIHVPVLGADELGDLASSFNEMIARLREREALDAELLASRARTITAADAERRRVERALEAGPRSRLVLAQRSLAAIEEAIDRNPAAALAAARRLHDLLGGALAQLRELAHGMYPALLENEGLAAALQEVVERAPSRVRLECAAPGRHSRETEAAVYFCCLEAVQNLAGHDPSAAVKLAEEGGTLRFEIATDRGFSDAAARNGPATVQLMSDRVGALGGELTVERSPIGGATVIGRVPRGAAAESTASEPTSAGARHGQAARPNARGVLQSLYERTGSSIILPALVAGGCLALVTGLVAAVTFQRYLALPGSRYLPLLAIWIPAALAALLGALLASRHRLRGIVSWSRSDRSGAAAQDAWAAIVQIPAVLTRAAFPPSLAIAAALLYSVVLFHEPAWAIVPFEVAALILIAAAWIAVVFTLELTMRPMLEDVAAHLPAEHEPQAHGLSLATKALGPLPVVAVYGFFAVGAFTNAAGDHPVRLTIALGVTLAAIAVASVAFAVVTRSVLNPVDKLTGVTRRVRDGDLAVSVPLVSGDELGKLAVSFNHMIAGLRERETLRSELRRSRARIVAAADAERRHLERDLHDGAQQHVLVQALKLGMVGDLLERDPQQARSITNELRQDFERTLGELDDLAREIYPQTLVSEGLREALREAVSRTAIQAQLDYDGAGRYSPELEAAVYFCCLEALQNAAKHAGNEARATVRLEARENALGFEVADNGCGYDRSAAAPSAGLQNMADRIGALGGELRIVSTPGTGTTITGNIPVTG